MTSQRIDGGDEQKNKQSNNKQNSGLDHEAAVKNIQRAKEDLDMNFDNDDINSRLDNANEIK